MQSPLFFLLDIILVIITMIVVLYSTPEEIKKGIKFDFTLYKEVNFFKAAILYVTSIILVLFTIFLFVIMFFHNKTWPIIQEYWILYCITLAIGLVVILWRVIAAFRHNVK